MLSCRQGPLSPYSPYPAARALPTAPGIDEGGRGIKRPAETPPEARMRRATKAIKRLRQETRYLAAQLKFETEGLAILLLWSSIESQQGNHSITQTQRVTTITLSVLAPEAAVSALHLNEPCRKLSLCIAYTIIRLCKPSSLTAVCSEISFHMVYVTTAQLYFITNNKGA